MDNREKLLAAATIAHLLEFIDTRERLDYRAALSTLKQSGLTTWVADNTVMIPLRRDGRSQADRFFDQSEVVL